MLAKPLNPMVLLIIIPFLNDYFIGNIPNIFRQTHIETLRAHICLIKKQLYTDSSNEQIHRVFFLFDPVIHKASEDQLFFSVGSDRMNKTSLPNKNNQTPVYPGFLDC